MAFRPKPMLQSRKLQSGKLHGRQVALRAGAIGKRLFGMRRKIATVLAGILAVMLGFHVVFGRNGLTAFRTKRHDLHDLQAQVKTLQRENSELQGHVDRLTSDPNAIEHQAREDLHYTRPGEVIFTLPPEKPSTQPIPPPAR